MSESEPDFEKYRGTAGAEVKTANVSGNDHALKQKLGNEDDAKERIYDAKIAGERFVQFYDDSAAAIREYLSNAETACIRRAKHELLDAGFSENDIPSEVADLLEMAKEECGYEPLIEVTYNRKADDTRFIIEDNGIGISTEEYQVLQRIGYSASHMDGERLGQFGMGFMSGFQLTSVNGVFRMYTRSYLTDEAYSTAEYVANCEFLDAAPQEYGTKFEFPGFGEAGKQINIPSKVDEYCEGMRVPVLYRDFDESGDETHRSDDYLPRNMEDDYSDDSMTVVYEDEFFKAVMSPDSPENRRSLVTYNVTMPIRRNCDEWGSDPKFDAPWKFDFRGKKENGPIVACESDPSVVGLIPKEDSKYERLVDDFKDECIRMSEVPDDAIKMPDPASSRDSYKNGHDGFWRHVSRKLNEKWAEVAREHFVGLDTWDDFVEMEREDKQALFRAYGQFGPSYGDNEPDNIQETLEDNLDVTVPLDVCEKIDQSRKSVLVVQRGSDRAHTKKATKKRKIWKIIDNAPDGVYIGKSISQKKAEIAWGLGETDVVRVESTDKYAEYEDNWGWAKLKDLPSRNLGEKLPELDDDIIEKYEDTSASASNNTKSTGGNGRDPEVARIKVRTGAGRRRDFKVWRVSDLVDKLEQDEMFHAGRSCRYVILFDNDTSARTAANHAKGYKGIAATCVPKYVKEYLKTKQNVYESYDDLRAELAGCDVTLSDDTEMDIRDVPSSDMLIFADREVRDYFEDRPEELAELLDYDSDEYDRYTFLMASDLDDPWDAETDATVAVVGDASRPDLADYDRHKDDYFDLRLRDEFGDVDKSSDEYEALFGYRHGDPNRSTKETLLEIAADADCL